MRRATSSDRLLAAPPSPAIRRRSAGDSRLARARPPRRPRAAAIAVVLFTRQLYLPLSIITRYWTVSASGWRSDGRELFFVDQQRWVNAVAVTSTNQLQIGEPIRRFELPPDSSVQFTPYRCRPGRSAVHRHSTSWLGETDHPECGPQLERVERSTVEALNRSLPERNQRDSGLGRWRCTAPR